MPQGTEQSTPAIPSEEQGRHTRDRLEQISVLPQEVCVKESMKSHEPSSGLQAQLHLRLVCLKPCTQGRGSCLALRGRHLEPCRTRYGASQQGLLTGHLVVRGTSWAGSAHVLKSRM